MGNIVLVGAGGAGMSALAMIFHELDFKNLVCIDSTASQITETLQGHGIQVYVGNHPYVVKPEDYVIYSEACKDSPEIKLSRSYTEEKIYPYHYALNYFQFIGEISKHFFTVAVAGTNGKSSTTSLLIQVLSSLSPRFGVGIVGALVPDFGNVNYKLGHKDAVKSIFEKIVTGKITHFDHSLLKKYFFVIESCEYKRHFLNMDVDYSMIANVELDHTDYYKDDADYQDAFNEFFDRTRYEVFLRKGEKSVDFLRTRKSEKTCDIENSYFDFQHLLGDFNQANASLVQGMAEHVLEFERSGIAIRGDDSSLLTITDIDRSQIKNLIEQFRGIWRRLEKLVDDGKRAIVYSDYGHHPSSLEVVFDAVKKKYPEKKIVAVFQPHQAKRVLEFWHPFSEVLKKFDQTMIYSIYTARENLQELLADVQVEAVDTSAVQTVSDLGNLFAQSGGAVYTEQVADVLELIEKSTQTEVIVIFTAGDLDRLVRGSL
ncbi:MAG TPA: cyanophycin synthetase [Candidatus Absconditabacterales bacterium]|nr:cyanophycin synthetase [Candidatus Absconditabacterales bacterium]